jgi:Spy/CpxP family protein refolding chaperone
MKTAYSKYLSQATLIAALAISAGFATAQTQPGMQGANVGANSTVPRDPAAHRMAAHGHGRGDLGQRLEAVKTQLNLNPTQEAQFVTAKAATDKAMTAGKTAHMNVRATAKAEMGKADPDLGKLLTMRESAQEAAAAERKAATAEWAKFLNLLNPEQKAVVKSLLVDRMHRAEAMREKSMYRNKG